MLLSPYFLLGWPPVFMTNTLTLPVFCVYFLFPFSLFLCLLFVWVLTSAKGIPLHSAAMPIAISYTPEQYQHHLLTLTTVFCCSFLGDWCCSRVEPAYQSWIVGRVTCLWGKQSHHHCFTIFFLKISLSLRLSRFLHFSLSLQGYRICSFQKKKIKTVLQSHNLWPDRFLSITLDCEGERERETDRQFQKVSLRPLQHEASVVDKTIQTERERERGGTRDYKPKCMHQPIAGQDPGSTATSRCCQSQAKDGHDGIGSDVAPAKRFFKVHWHNRSSFFPVDWHSEHHKKKLSSRLLNEIVNACLKMSSARRRSKSSELVVRHFLVGGTAGWPRSRNHDARACGQAHLDAILSHLALAQTSPISPHSLEMDLYVRF